MSASEKPEVMTSKSKGTAHSGNHFRNGADCRLSGSGPSLKNSAVRNHPLSHFVFLNGL